MSVETLAPGAVLYTNGTLSKNPAPELVIDNTYKSGSVNFNDGRIVTIDATASKTVTEIYGNSNDNVIHSSVVNHCDIYGGAGNDKIYEYSYTIQSGKPYVISSVIDGGAGDDEIYLDPNYNRNTEIYPSPFYIEYSTKKFVYSYNIICWSGTADSGNDIVHNFNYTKGDRLKKETLVSPSLMTYTENGTKFVITSVSGKTLTLYCQYANGVNDLEDYLKGLGMSRKSSGTGTTTDTTVTLATGAILHTSTGELAITANYTQDEVNFADSRIRSINATSNTSVKAIYGNSSANTILGAKNSQHTDIHGGAGNDVIRSYAAGTEISEIYGDGGNDTIYLDGGKERLNWSGTSDDGSDTVHGFDLSTGDSLCLTNPETMLYAEADEDIIITSADNTTLTLKSVNTAEVTEYLVELGLKPRYETLATGAVLDVLTGQLTLETTYTQENVNFTDSRIKDIDATGNTNIKRIYGNDSVNTIIGAQNAQYSDIYGGAGDDIIKSYAAGTGYSDIYGGAGNDTIYLNGQNERINWSGVADEGSDTVYNFNLNNNASLRLTNPSSMSYAISGSDISISSVNNTTLSLNKGNITEIKDYLAELGVREELAEGALLDVNTGKLTLEAAYSKEKVNFTDNRIQEIDATGNAYVKTILGTDEANTIIGTAETASCAIYGEAGDDIIKSYASGTSSSYIEGGAGDDIVYLYGKKQCVSWAGNDNCGSDIVYGFNRSNADTLSLAGTLFNKYLQYVTADEDIIIISNIQSTNSGSSTSITSFTKGTTKTLTLKNGNTTAIKNYLTSLNVQVASAEETLATGALLNPYSGKLTISQVYTNAKVNFSDDRIKNIDASLNTTVTSITGNSEANVITGPTSASAVTIHAGVGDDTIISKAQGTVLSDMYGDGGDDVITLATGKERINWSGTAASGNDTVYNFAPDQGDVLELTSPATMSYAVDGDDIVVSSTSVTITLTLASANNDSVKNYLNGLGLTQEVSTTTETTYVVNNRNTYSGFDPSKGSLNFENPTTMQYAASGNDILIFSTSTNKLILKDAANAKVTEYLEGLGVTKAPVTEIETVHAGDANNVILTSQTADIYGDGGDDIINIISTTAAIVDGGTGNDTVRIFNGSANHGQGNDGNDILTLYGNDSQNELKGGAGDDTYKIMSKLTEGTSIVVDQSDAGNSDNDRLILAKVSKKDVSYALEGSDLKITDTVNGGCVAVKDWSMDSLKKIIFNDGVMAVDPFKATSAEVYGNGTAAYSSLMTASCSFATADAVDSALAFSSMEAASVSASGNGQNNLTMITGNVA